MKLKKNVEKYLNDLIVRTIQQINVCIEDQEFYNKKELLDELITLGYIKLIPVYIYSPNIISIDTELKMDKNQDFESEKINYHQLIIDEKIIALMAQKRLKNKNIKSGHDQIIYSLVNFLKKDKTLLFFSNFEIKTKFGSSRPDLYVIKNDRSMNEITPICYEIKHSHNDFMSDLKNKNKRSSYLEISPQLYYVCPKNVIKKDEIPEEAGLIYMDEFKNFEIIKNAPMNKSWHNNFNERLINTLIRHKSNENFDFFVSEKANANSSICKGNFNDLCACDDVILLNSSQILVIEAFMKKGENMTFKDLPILPENYGAVYDLIGLDLIRVTQERLWYYCEYKNDCNVLKLTEKGERLISEFRNLYENIIDWESVFSRQTSKKFIYNNVKIKDLPYCFDFYAMNKNKNMDQLLLTGFITVNNKSELNKILSDKEKINNLKRYCQKIAFANFNGSVKKEDLPKEFSLFEGSNNTKEFTFPQKEIKRGEKRKIQEVDNEILLSLLNKEYYGRKCFIFSHQ